MTHLRFAGLPGAEQRAAVLDILRACPGLMATLHAVRDLDLPDWWVVSGAIYNRVWNHLTHRPEAHGIKDTDLFYFDPDLSQDREQAVMARVVAVLPPGLPVDVRNQARVHLWFAERFGHPCPAYANAHEPIANFASKTHAVAVRLLADDSLSLFAPFGLDDILSFRLVPNPALPNRATHEEKAARQLALWPELTFVPWPVEANP